jgi:CheY-like chemotaxis protein
MMVVTKILLAEDDADDQMLFNDYLKDRNDIVILPIAENGEEVFKILDNIKEDNDLPGLIILDQNMPKRNGLQTLRLLKETSRYAEIPIVFYSTYADHQLINACTEIGAITVMTKPLTKEGYDKMIDSFLKAIRK